jgi:hypothetical protein
MATIGRHFWTRLDEQLAPCPALFCDIPGSLGSTRGVSIREGTGFTVEGVVPGMGYYYTSFYAQVRLDDGQRGFFFPSSWNVEDPKVSLAKFHAKIDAEMAAIDARFAKQRTETKAAQERRGRCISGLEKLRIGMTDAEARPIIDCVPLPKINSTETASGVRKQVVLYFDESWTVGYLYFEGGRLVGIQRSR